MNSESFINQGGLEGIQKVSNFLCHRLFRFSEDVWKPFTKCLGLDSSEPLETVIEYIFQNKTEEGLHWEDVEDLAYTIRHKTLLIDSGVDVFTFIRIFKEELTNVSFSKFDYKCRFDLLSFIHEIGIKDEQFDEMFEIEEVGNGCCNLFIARLGSYSFWGIPDPVEGTEWRRIPFYMYLTIKREMIDFKGKGK